MWWSSRDLTIFERVMILKIFGLSQLVFFGFQTYSPSRNGGFSKKNCLEFFGEAKKIK